MKSLKRLPVGTQLLLAFGTLCAILAIIGALFFFSLRSIERSNQVQLRATTELALIDDTAQDIGQMQAEVLRQILSSDTVEIRRLDRNIRDIEQINATELANYQKFVDTEKEKQLYDRVMLARKTYWGHTQPVLALGLTNMDAEAIEFVNSTQAPAYDELLKTVDDLIQYVESNANKTATDTTRFISGIRIIGDVLVGLTIFIAVGTAFGVAVVGRRLKEDNQLLKNEVAERKRAEDELHESQALYLSLVDQMPAGIFRKDMEGRLVFVNSWYCKLKGVNADRFLGKTPMEVAVSEMAVPGAKYPNAMNDTKIANQGENHHAQILQTRGTIEIEEQYSDAEGQTHYFRVVKTPVFDSGGKIIGTQGMLFDITGRKKTEELLRESEENFSTAFEQAPIGVALVSPDGRWLKVNKALCDLLGYSETELLGRTVLDLTRPEEVETSRENMRRTIAGEIRSFQLEKNYLHKTGRIVTTLLNVSLVRDGQDKPRYFIAQLQDITERKRVEGELQWKSAFLEAQVNSSIDGILVVDERGKKSLQNQRFTDLLKIPQHIADDKNDEHQLRWVTGVTKNPGQFIEKVVYLNSHPEETSLDEIEFKDGAILDRYSAPVLGTNGKYYGRIWTFRDITGRKRAEESLRESEERFSSAFELAPIGMALVAPAGRWLKVNRALCELVGYSEAELLARTFQEITHPDDLAADLECVRRLLAGEIRFYQIEKRYIHESGHFVTVLLDVSLVRDALNQPLYFIAQIQDITERKRLETQLFQSQKMETVGKLAGGIAHEFNSILTAIIGQSELLLGDLPPENPLVKSAEEIRKAAERAAVLTRQLLAYGRKQILQPEVLNLNAVVTGMESVLLHLMGRGVQIQFNPAAGLKPVKADAGQIEQVIINIVMNAADAMPNGGKLTLETASVTLDAAYTSNFPELKAGKYVMLSISDTGAGMSEETKARLFEPFFTTKDVGNGTGLGLATCHGIVKQSGGHIAVYSELGRGTTFKIYLPQVGQEMKPPAQPKSSPDLPRGTERILLVEDDPSLREMAGALLERLGYTVLTAANGIEAMSHVHQQGRGHIDLVFTDVVMPHMSGNELASRIHALHPQTKILFTSAYTESAIVHQGILNKGVALLQKPFTPSALANKLREVLDNDS